MIQVRGLSKRFGQVLALDGVSFAVERGETLALLGPNGSGKTTTLKCIAGLTFPSAGEILVTGIDALKARVGARKAISYLPQRVAFPEQVTAREVLDYYRRLRNLPAGRVDAAIEQCALGNATDRLVSEFSGGMMQRLGIAVAVLADSPILLLDEPTASLDPEAAADFRSFLAKLKAIGKTIVFSSHVLSDVELLADRVAILVGGRLRAIETIDALREHLNAESILRVQLGNTNKRFCSVATAAGAAEVHCSTDGLIISARPDNRYSILRALESSGAEIVSLATVEPSLEDVYLRYLHENPFDLALNGPGAVRDGLRDSIAATG